jgi:hypothetical protein
VPGAQASPTNPIYLDGSQSFEQLRYSNPRHYEQALRILAAADEICRPHAAQIEFSRFGARDVGCQAAFLLTSNPPKRQLSFTLDDTHYIARVAITSDPPKLVKALR